MNKELINKYIKLTKENRLYNLPCPVVGLTGGIATGKSTVSKMLVDLGLNIICADTLVKSVYKTKKTLEYLKSHHQEVINSEGVVDFQILRKLFFSDKIIKENIEQLIYSQLPEAFLNEYKKLNGPSVVIYDVPLLFEKGLDKLVDLKVVVYCSRDQQIDRLIKRDSIDRDLATKILNNQMDIEEKKRLADIIIENQTENGPKLDPFLDCFV